MSKLHQYTVNVMWTGNTGLGTSSYTAYERAHTISVENKVEIQGSSDPSFRGDNTKYNPEELFLASISSCHMLWYLHLCSENGIIVCVYQDRAEGIMVEDEKGSGRFTSVTLTPHVKIQNEEKIGLALQLHHKANEMCFIANSCNFKIEHAPTCEHMR